jgi:hypothetical protein
MLITPELPTELDIEGVPNTGAPIALVWTVCPPMFTNPIGII